MYSIKKIYLIGIFCSIGIALSAQIKRHEISFGVSGGMSALHYKVTEGKFTPQGGGAFGLGYLLRINHLWGIGTGTELSFYQSKVHISQYTDNYSILSSSIQGGTTEQNVFDFKFSYTDFQENQRIWFLNIPIYAQIQSQQPSGVYAKAGIKIGIPITAVYKSRYSALQTSAYFPYEGTEYTDLPHHGFGTYPASRDKSDLNVGYSLSPFIEIGWKWELGTSHQVYMGIYGEYGTRTIYNSSDKKPLLEYLDDNIMRQNTLWDSRRQEGENPREILSSKIYPMSVGVTLRWAFLR